MRSVAIRVQQPSILSIYDVKAVNIDSLGSVMVFLVLLVKRYEGKAKL